MERVGAVTYASWEVGRLARMAYDGDGRLVRFETRRGTTLESSVTYVVGGTVVPPAFPRECPEQYSELFRD